MAKESVLTIAEKESFKIKKLIFHIIKQSDLNPIFLDEVVLTAEQSTFFSDRFSDASQGTQFEFNDKKTSEVYKECKLIVANAEKHFHEMSKSLTASFQTHHKKTTNDGVFITALVSVLDEVDLIFLIKLDNRKVYEYLIKDKKAIMQEIKNTFVEDKRAVQKVAIIDVSDYFIWDALAYDRNPSPGKTIRDFFADFLAVHERETPAVLTKKTISAINQWAIANRQNLDPSQDVSAYKNRVIDYLRNVTKTKSATLINTVIFDEDSARSSKLKKSLRTFLQEKGLYGQEFAPNKSSLDNATVKNVRKTAEGVKIEWDGDAKDVNITIPNVPNDNDGLVHITIKTHHVDIIK